MTAFDSPDESLLSASHLIGWKAERDALDNEIAERQKRREEVQRKLDLAAELLGPDAVVNVIGPSALNMQTPRAVTGTRVRANRETWGRAMLEIIRDAGRGISHKELRDRLLETSFRDRLEQTDSAFYSTIGKFVGSKKLIKHNGRLYTPDLFEAFQRDVEEGRAQDFSFSPKHLSPVQDAVRRLLSRYPRGTTSKVLIADIRKDPELASLVAQGTTNVFNALSRMRGRGAIIKEGTVYRLSPTNEALPELTESAPQVTGEAPTSPIESGDVNADIFR